VDSDHVEARRSSAERAARRVERHVSDDDLDGTGGAGRARRQGEQKHCKAENAHEGPFQSKG
jgi:hypothetical protein